MHAGFGIHLHLSVSPSAVVIEQLWMYCSFWKHALETVALLRNWQVSDEMSLLSLRVAGTALLWYAKQWKAANVTFALWNVKEQAAFWFVVLSIFILNLTQGVRIFRYVWKLQNLWCIKEYWAWPETDTVLLSGRAGDAHSSSEGESSSVCQRQHV